MKGISQLISHAFWAILLTLPAITASAQSLNPGQAKLETYLKTLSNNNKIMTAVYVSQNGVPRYEHYAGLASVEENVPISAQTRFRIGSISKTYTAVLIMQLIEADKLSLDTRACLSFINCNVDCPIFHNRGVNAVV